MKGFSFICPFFILCIISSSYSSEGAFNGLGIAVCDNFGFFKSKCNIKDLQPENFPPECTSFFYSGLDLSNGTSVQMDMDNMPKGYLDSLLALKKPIIALLTRTSWNKDIKGVQQNGAESEIAMVKTFLDQNTGITGLALYKLEISYKDEEDTEYTQNLITYIGLLKKNFPQLKIGLYLNNGEIINTLDTPQLKSLDLSLLDKNVDFFRLLSAKDLYVDECTSPNYIHGDVVMNQFNKKVLDYISGLNLPKEKIVWDVWGSPTNANLGVCDLTYTNMCLNPKRTYCADTQQKLYDKAKYIREIAGGFALNYMYKDDVDSSCKCDRKFPVFYALWDGFNGNPEPNECNLMDRPNL